MIELIVLDICAVLMTPDSRVRLYVSQAEKDGLLVYCYGDLPRRNLRTALRTQGYLDIFDSILHEEIMLAMTSEELRRLADTTRVRWVRTPSELDYNLILPLLPERKRALPRALRLLGQPLEQPPIFDEGSDLSD